MRNHNKKKHLWVSEEQDNKLTKLKNELGLNASDVFRMAIDKDYPYINLYYAISAELKKQGTNINQIAKRSNTNRKVDEQILKEIQEIKTNQQAILKTLRNSYDN
ncbi:plasmid mobilization relaxosome protein MobC [Parapusillimonas sp. JC17]|uniref:plasmid mobilization relaxosome protein MobC n=1 Tax=Parapusillimonas sp. JC17 TaxID=3445768 RepID=UPI003FA0D8D7